MQTKMQIGKNGLTPGVVEKLKSSFKNHHVVRISVLKSAGHTKENIQEINKKLLDGLGKKFVSKIIGFTIIVRKIRGKRR